MIDAPQEWNHVRGYRLNADGKAIEYEHPNGLTAYIEGMLDEDDGEFKYLLSIIREDGSFAEFPEPFLNKDSAIEQLENWMNAYK